MKKLTMAGLSLALLSACGGGSDTPAGLSVFVPAGYSVAPQASANPSASTNPSPTANANGNNNASNGAGNASTGTNGGGTNSGASNSGASNPSVSNPSASNSTNNNSGGGANSGSGNGSGFIPMPTAAPTVPAPTAIPTLTATPTAPATPTTAPSPTTTTVPSPTATVAPSPSAPATPTTAPSPTGTAMPTTTTAPSPTAPATPTTAPSPTAPATPTATVIPSPTTTTVPSPTATVAPSPTTAPSPTATVVPSPTAPATPTATVIPSPTTTTAPSPTATAVPSPTIPATPTATARPTPADGEGSGVIGTKALGYQLATSSSASKEYGQFSGPITPSAAPDTIRFNEQAQIGWINGTASGELQIPTDRNLTNHDAGTVTIMGNSGSVRINTQVNAIGDRGKAVHFTGNSDLGGIYGTVPVNGAYVVGERSLEMPASGTATYRGPASYSGYDDTAISSGSSNAQVDFGQKTMNLNISVPSAQVNENFTNMAISGNKFGAGVGYDGLQIGPAQNGESRTSGYFYGDQAEALGGTFYNTRGLGTYTGTKE